MMTNIGFKNDKVFLLSIDEYKQYRNVIPHNNIWWWLRTSGENTSHVAVVNPHCYVNQYGDAVFIDNNGVRPALRFDEKIKIGEEFIFNNRPFTVIDDCLAIASVPITFDKFDDRQNDYENSYIRKWLLEWGDNNE